MSFSQDAFLQRVLAGSSTVEGLGLVVLASSAEGAQRAAAAYNSTAAAWHGSGHQTFPAAALACVRLGVLMVKGTCSLEVMLNKYGRMLAWQVVLVMRGVSDALECLEQLQAAHGDLKPGNVLVSATSQQLPGQTTVGVSFHMPATCAA